MKRFFTEFSLSNNSVPLKIDCTIYSLELELEEPCHSLIPSFTGFLVLPSFLFHSHRFRLRKTGCVTIATRSDLFLFYEITTRLYRVSLFATYGTLVYFSFHPIVVDWIQFYGDLPSFFSGATLPSSTVDWIIIFIFSLIFLFSIWLYSSIRLHYFKYSRGRKRKKNIFFFLFFVPIVRRIPVVVVFFYIFFSLIFFFFFLFFYGEFVSSHRLRWPPRPPLPSCFFFPFTGFQFYFNSAKNRPDSISE